jgi:hypothetical protein
MRNDRGSEKMSTSNKERRRAGREVVRFIESKWEQGRITTDDMIDVLSGFMALVIDQHGARAYNFECANPDELEQGERLSRQRLLELHPEFEGEVSRLAARQSVSR